MNDNDFMNSNSSEKNTYRATPNLNTAIENPQINMNSAVGVNIKSVDSNKAAPSYEDGVNYSSYQVENSVNYSETSQSNLNSQFYNQNFSNQKVDEVYQTKKENSQFIPTNSEMNYEPTFGTDNVGYEPTMKENKRHDKESVLSREFKVLLFIVFILFVFLLIMPYIYDFFQKLMLEF